MMSNKRKYQNIVGSYLAGIATLFFVLNIVQAEETPYLLTDAQWNVPRTESAILAMPTLQSVMKAYQGNEGVSRLLIKYPGGDEGTLWAYELRGWLISLGVASSHIELVPGSRDANQLEIFVMTTREQR